MTTSKTLVGRLAIPASLHIDRRRASALHLQLYEGYRGAIAAGRLRAGQRLPSTRELCRELGLSRTPVLLAFERLRSEGYLETRRGSGTFVAIGLAQVVEQSAPQSRGPRRSAARDLSRLPELHRRSATAPWFGGLGPFRLSAPALEEFPTRLWARLVGRHLRVIRRSRLFYGHPMGDVRLREAIAAYLRTARAARCDAEHVMVVSGSQEAIGIAARALLPQGARVWVEEPGYPGAWEALVLAGARPVPVPVDGEGLVVSAGARAGRRAGARARAALVTPSHQYPLGATMSAARRLQLLDWARAHDAWILEDDYDSEYRYDTFPIASLQGLDRDDRVIYIGTLSKVLCPGLRVGYLVIPPDLVERFVTVREALDIAPPSLVAAPLADFLLEGHFARHLQRTSLVYRSRRETLVRAVREQLGGRWEVAGAQAGMHLALVMRGATAHGLDVKLSESLALARVWAMPLSACFRGPPSAQGLVLGFGGAPSAVIPDAVRTIARLSGDLGWS